MTEFPIDLLRRTLALLDGCPDDLEPVYSKRTK